MEQRKTPNMEEQMRIICKGVEKLVGEEELRTKLARSLETGRPLRIKLGLDPSAPDIHLGHTVVLRKIRQMQKLGHEAVIVIGDFTGKIGDPTGKAKGRAALSEEQVKENAKTYFEQIFRVLDEKKTRVVYNSEWLAKLTLEDVVRLAATTTVARMLERDDFHNRYSRQIPIGIHEFLYPLMQAYDSVELQADVELGGTDQTFNILMGRSLQKEFGQEPQAALFMPLLEGLDGVEKMSKSLGNYIGVKEPAQVMFKKCMEVPDALILRYFELVTDVHPDRVEELREKLLQGENPRNIKLLLAREITKLYYSLEETDAAEKFYHTAFSKKAIPEDIPELVIAEEKDLLQDVIPLLVQGQWVASRNEFIRLLKQGGIQLDGEKLTADDLSLVIIGNQVLKIGKKKFVRLVK